MSSRPNAESICAFVALELSRTTQTAVAREITRLEKELPGLSWMDAHRTHITLRFLGWTNRERTAALGPVLAAAAKACPPFEATISGLGTFPPGPDRPRVLWAAVDLPRPAHALQAACEAAAVSMGFPPERRAFRGHITLARWKVPGRMRGRPDLDLGSTHIENLVLFRTEPGRDATLPGVRRQVSAYSKLAVFPLG